MAAVIREVLARSPVFQELSAQALAAIAEKGVPRRLRRRELLFNQGDPADEFAVVVEGRLKLSQVTAEGQELIVRYVGPGEMCAVVALFAGQDYPATAEAVGDTSVIAWPRGTLDELMRAHPQLALNVLRLLSERMGELSDRLRELSTERVARRVARALLRLAGKAGRRTDRGVEIDMPLTREDIARLTGTTLFTVSRLMADWEEAGIVASGRERVVIRSPHGLVAIAEDLPAE
jgi:CRP-like cAMP-binding protein